MRTLTRLSSETGARTFLVREGLRFAPERTFSRMALRSQRLILFLGQRNSELYL